MISVSICVWWLDLNGFKIFMPTDGDDDIHDDHDHDQEGRCVMLVITMTMRMMMVPMMTTTMTRRGGVPCWGLRVVLFCARQRWAAMSARDPVSSLGAQVVQTILLQYDLAFTYVSSYLHIVKKKTAKATNVVLALWSLVRVPNPLAPETIVAGWLFSWSFFYKYDEKMYSREVPGSE